MSDVTIRLTTANDNLDALHFYQRHGFHICTTHRVLNLCASEWLDEFGLTWLEYAPKIKMLKVDDFLID